MCHDYHSKNPGRVVTRYEFNQLFSKAWFKAMTAMNIITSFRATGGCPFDRSALAVEEVESDGVLKPEKLAQKTGLAYIPLYSPSRASPAQTSTPRRPVHQSSCSLSDSEILCTSNLSQSMLDTYFAQSIVPLRRATTTSIYFNPPLPPHQEPVKRGKSSGCILTSPDNLLKTAEKEKARLEEAQKKEDRKRIREERKLQREREKGNVRTLSVDSCKNLGVSNCYNFTKYNSSAFPFS